jgi:hypothetical protein
VAADIAWKRSPWSWQKFSISASRSGSWALSSFVATTICGFAIRRSLKLASSFWMM